MLATYDEYKDEYTVKMSRQEYCNFQVIAQDVKDMIDEINMSLRYPKAKVENMHVKPRGID